MLKVQRELKTFFRILPSVAVIFDVVPGEITSFSAVFCSESFDPTSSIFSSWEFFCFCEDISNSSVTEFFLSTISLVKGCL